MWLCIAFALLAYGVAVQGFWAMQELTDPAERDLYFGYAGFWAFLGAIATVFGVLSWMMKEGKLGNNE